MDNLLSILIFVPLLAAVILAIFLRGDDEAAQQNAKWLGVTATGSTLFVAGILYLAFDGANAGTQLIEERQFPLGITYRIGVDGLSLPFVVALTALMPIVIGISWSMAERVRDFIIALLVFETLALGALLALEVPLFLLFFETAIVPLLVMCALWGGVSAPTTAVKSALFMVPGAVLLSVVLGMMAREAGTADMSALMLHNFAVDRVEVLGFEVAGGAQTLLVLGMALSLASKLTIWPLHGWAREAVTQAPIAASIALVGLLPLVGAYALMRLPLAMLPEGLVAIAPYAMALGIIGAVYGALAGFKQEDAKKLLAYALGGQAGLIVIGLVSATQQGIDGAVLLAASRAFAVAGLFFVLAMLELRMGSRAFETFGGLRCNLKSMGFFALFFVAAALGVPGTGGFVGQLLIFIGTFGVASWAVMGGALAVACLAVALFAFHKKLMLGELVKESLKVLSDLDGRERFICVLLGAVLIILGLMPRLITAPIGASVGSLVALYGG